ncbi:ISLre2 family transposase [Streptococcus ovis]|uniref:ISLre2 family transposase n=1 Tax=Streptococcus ovis TaxID=82806 RepID=UPI000367C003|nr:ISLre2 family transposase [Streptococcus ovis]
MKTENQYLEEFRMENIAIFLKELERYEKEIATSLRARGYTKINKSPRTVLFPFGEITFYRSRWYKDGQCFVPVDEKLGLEKNSRFSPEFLYHISRLSTYMSYRQVVEVVELVYGLFITKDTVLKAVRKATALIKEQSEYRFLGEEKNEKRKPKYLYIEGDGVFLKANSHERSKYNAELTHFVVHEGCDEMTETRSSLQNKKEFVAVGKGAREALLDYLYNHYDLTDTILITNSDGGSGYSPAVFRDIAKAMNVKQHEHFWDAYHVNKIINDLSRGFSFDAGRILSEAIARHDRKKLRLALDTIESMIEDEEETKNFQKIYRRFISDFRYTKPAKMRGLSSKGIGIIESQHRKITYRMKNQGMSWSISGLETMSQLILLRHEGNMRDLFFGTWREEYKKINDLDKISAEYYIERAFEEKKHSLPNARIPQYLYRFIKMKGSK